MLVLAVQFDQACRQLAQRRRGRERAVHEGPAAALRRNLAAHEELLSCAFEDGFDRRGFLTGPDELSRRPTAQQKSDRLDENRLSGTGLAGQHVEAGLELDLRLVDDSQMSDAQEAEHGGSRKTRTPIVT